MTVPTPTMNTANLPQADRLDRVRNYVERVHSYSHSSPPSRVPQPQEFGERDEKYYRRAGLSLGLLESRDEDSTLSITERGERLLASPQGSTDEAMCFRQGIESSFELRPFHGYLLTGDSLSKKELAILIAKSSGLKLSTAERRAQTMSAWRTYLDIAISPASHAPRDAPSQQGLFTAISHAPKTSLLWPPKERFPRNERPTHRVGDVVVEDLRTSETVLIITGYTSLEYLLGYLGQVGERPTKIRVAFGVEPPLDDPEGIEARSQANTIADAMRDYWLRRGISILTCHAVLHTLNLLDNDRLEVRVSPNRRSRVHAKIYVSDGAATLGSSNFSKGGMTNLTEVNARFRSDDEHERYLETVAFAEKTWGLTVDFKDEFRKLLMQLVKPVTWMEAIARASAALLEGEWASDQILGGEFARALWPSQVQGIKQALWLVENVGTVVVADATGSGKTRMGAQLLRCVRDRQWTGGSLSKAQPGDPVLICPPAVIESWRDELVGCGLSIEPYSHGRLSGGRASTRETMLRAVRQASILAVDEAHNFHNPRSQRTAALLSGTADQNLLFTATPLNREAKDLLSIVEILGADNLDDKTLNLLQEKLWRPGSRPHELTPEDLGALRLAIRHFMVRRTKRMLNDLVDRAPEAYLNRQGNPCRYPHSIPRVYALGETPADCAQAEKICALAHRLRGILYLRKPLVLSKTLRSWGMTPKRYCHMRLLGAAGLAAYHVMATLRSSRAALYEHIRGTEYALAHFDIPPKFKSASTGDQLGRLHELVGTAPPTQPLYTYLPAWLTDQEEYAAAIAEEESIYREIVEHCGGLSGGRESAKAEHLSILLETHDLVLAFDSRPITLGYLRQLLSSTPTEVLVATGDSRSSSQRRKVLDRFALGSRGRRALALCSDALSEGINLQQGSAVVHLDMPSVIRVAEQRVGRIDRMDSPHANIEVWWPGDNESFTLQADKKLFGRSELVSSLIGSNLNLPQELKGAARPQDFITALDEDTDADLDDAFAPIRRLVSGPQPLISPGLYDALRTTKVQILAYVACVRSSQPFLFATISIGKARVPRWVFIVEGEPPLTSLESVAQALRDRLPSAESRTFDETARDQLERWLRELANGEREILPPRKRRALELLEHTLRSYGKRAKREKEFDRLRLIADLRERLLATDYSHHYDLDLLASSWLEVLRPRILRHLEQRRRGRSRPFRLHDLKRELEQSPISDAELGELIARTPPGRPLGDRVVAAIVGVPSGPPATTPHPQLDLART